MRYFIYLSYDGSRYHGWQIQPNAISVQQELNRCLTTLLRTEVSSTGAGRTDTGVHARLMVAHFDVDKNVECEWFSDKLNRILPPDISVSCVRPVSSCANARFDAKARTYHYYIYARKSPFFRHYATRIPFPLDFEKMNIAAAMLLRVEDFTSFSKLHTDAKTNICHVSRAEWVCDGEGLWHFEITADRFLRNMVRAVVGTLIDVGRGRLSADDFRDIIERRDRCAAGDSMPANALFLVNIVYDKSIFL